MRFSLLVKWVTFTVKQLKQNIMKFEITGELANKVLSYLATRPYQEVAALIQEVQTIKPIEEPKVKKDGDKS